MRYAPLCRMMLVRMLLVLCLLDSTMTVDSISTRFWFEHKNGKRLYPYRQRDQVTRRDTFRVAEARSGNSRAKFEVQLDDIEEVYRYVFELGYSVRLKAMDGSSAALYNKTGRSITGTSVT